MESLISFFLVTALINSFCEVWSSYLSILYRSLSNVFLCMHLSFLFLLIKNLFQTVTSHKLLLELKSSIIIREGLTPFNHCWKRLTKWLPKNRWNFWWKKEDTLRRKEVTGMRMRMRTRGVKNGKFQKSVSYGNMWSNALLVKKTFAKQSIQPFPFIFVQNWECVILFLILLQWNINV